MNTDSPTPASARSRIEPHELVAQISRLPEDWHLAGSMSEQVLATMVKHAPREVLHSVETGSGKTTLLFSHLSRNHTVFAVEGDNRSITAVRSSPLLNAETVHFVEGFTQLTLPKHPFTAKLQMALIDGPHGYPFPDLEYYHIYPHLETGALLIVDDIQIPTIHRMHEILSEDDMFELLEVVDNAAFYRRTDAPVFNPCGDGWWEQQYNKRRHPIGPPPPATERLRKWLRQRLPGPVKVSIKKVLGRP